MIPRLLKSNSLNFNQGMPFDLVLSCNVVEGLNDKYELNMQLLNSDKLAQNLVTESIILAKPNMTSQMQPFVVETITKNIDGVLTIYATHIAQYRSKLIPVLPFTASNLSDALNQINSHVVENNIFTITTDKSVNTQYSISEPRLLRDLLGGKEGSLLDIYKGEYLFDRLNIQLLNRRGRLNAFRVMYGTNMTQYEQKDEFSWANSITGVLPFYKGYENEAEVIVVGDVQYSDNANNYTYKKTTVVDFSSKFSTKPTKEQLNQVGLEYMARKGLPLINIKASFEDISTLPNYQDIYTNISNLQLGDYVQVINSEYNTNVTTRVRELDYDVLLDRYNSITIGDAQTTINEAISNVVGGTSNTYYSGGNLNIDKIYPIGSIYMTTNNTNPSTIFEGTQWTQIKDRFLLASGDTYQSGATGGEANHTLTLSEMPRHQHTVYGVRGLSYNSPTRLALQNDGNLVVYASDGSVKFNASSSSSATKSYRATNIGVDSDTEFNGDGGSHNNMPPYLTVNIWQRIA